jgi:PPM family protein phosphatase
MVPSVATRPSSARTRSSGSPTVAPDPSFIPTAQALGWTVAMLSDRGRLRQGNEDFCGASPEAVIVCDGMGGAAAGEVASHLAVETFLAHLSATSIVATTSLTARTRLEKAVCSANHTVFQAAQKSRTLKGMGTTLVAALLERNNEDQSALWLAHVGDSRCYRLRAGALEPLTEDHSLVEEQIRAGLLSRVQASSSPIRNIITRAIGCQAKVETEIQRHPTQPGDLYLLASDGLTRDLTESEIAAILTRTSHAHSLQATCQALIDAANDNGGGDNITVALIAID